MGVLIHKDPSPMYFATGSITRIRLYATFHEKTAFCFSSNAVNLR